MHDLLEGSLMKNFTLLILKLEELGLYSVVELNENLNRFKYSKHDAMNKIPFNIKLAKDTQLKLSATHAWLLILIFPLICGCRFQNNVYYMHFVQLIEIHRKIIDDSFTESKLLILEDDIEKYLNEFKFLYSDVKISAKMHFLIHYPRSIRIFGTAILASTMRFDSKHSFFKRVHHQTHNHVNLLYSLADRHQDFQIFHLLADKYFIDFEFGSSHKVSEDFKEYVEMRLEINNMEFYKHITHNRITYTTNDVIVTKRQSESSFPQFALIKSIVYDVCSKKIYFSVEKLLTETYLRHLTGYLIAENYDYMTQFIALDQIAHHIPLNIHKIKNESLNDVNILVPKYPI